jgi:hypothetical protein
VVTLSIESWAIDLCVPPQRVNLVRVNPSLRVLKVKTVVHSVMSILMFSEIKENGNKRKVKLSCPLSVCALCVFGLSPVIRPFKYRSPFYVQPRLSS